MSTVSGLTALTLEADEVLYDLDPVVVYGESVETDELVRSDLNLRRTAGASFQEILPSLNGAFAGNPTTGVFSIRGLNQDGLFGGVGAETNPLATVFEDGIPLTTNTLRYLPTPIIGVDSLTLRKGPSNHWAGPASLAGSLHFETGEPSFTFAGRSVLEYSEDSTFSVFFSQNIPLIEDELAMRLSYYRFESDGQGRALNPSIKDFSAYDRDRIQMDLLWHLGASEENSLLFTLLNDQSGGNPQANTVILPGSYTLYDRTALINTPSSYPAERWAASLRGNFTLPGDVQLETITGFQTIDLGQNLDFDGGSLLNWTINGDTEEQIFSQSVTFSGESDLWDWKAGAYFEKSEYDINYSGIGIAPFPFGSPYQNRATTDVQTVALHGKVSREMGNGVTLTGGMRYQHDERDLTGASTFGLFPTQQAALETNDGVFLPSLELGWKPDEASSFTLAVARGHRASGVAFAPVAGIASVYDAESSWDLELVGRRDIGEDVTVSATVFYSWIEDQQVASNVPGGLPGVDLLIANAGESRRYGAELEVSWQPMSDLSLFANVAWLKTEFDELSLNGVDRSGQVFPNAPEWTAAFGIDYRHDSGFFASGSYTWSDSTYSTVDDPALSALETRSLLNARIGWSWENASVYFFGTNLLDDDYALYRGLPIPPAIPQVGKAGSSRMLGVGVEFQW